MLAVNCYSQKSIKKDSLFFSFDKDYIFFSNDNFDRNYFFQFKNEKFVTSAFGKITNENLFYFVQIDNKTIKSNSRRAIDLKEYISKNKKIFIEKSAKKLDSYKMMRFFDKYAIFFLVENKYILVKANATLAE